MKRANGEGTIVKLTGNRRRPYAIKKTLGYTEDGKLKYTYISYHRTYREASKALSEYNKDPYNLEKITFAELFKKYMEYKNYKGESLKRYNIVFNNYLTPLHNINVSLLDLKYVQSYFDNLVASKEMLKSVKAAIKGAMEYGAKRGYVPLSHLEMFNILDIKPSKETKSLKRQVFTPEEINYLWDNKDDAIYRVILFYIYTGLRFSELLNCEIHQEEKYLTVLKSKTAAGLRDVPLSDKALSLLPLPDVEYYNYRYALQLLSKQTGITHTAHDTRHTFISLMTEAGVDSRIIKKIVGHATNDITENVYTHINMERLIAEINKI